MLNLKIITGSTRPGRAAGKVIPWITAMSRERCDFDVDALDLGDWPLPILGETLGSVGGPGNPTFSVPAVRQWNAKIAEGDAYLFVTPGGATIGIGGRTHATGPKFLSREEAGPLLNATFSPLQRGRHPDAGRPAVPAPARRARRVVTARGGPAMTPDERPP